jgi:hypothetical protein
MTCNMQSKPNQPYLDFLNAVDVKLNIPVELRCIGGFVVSQFYGLLRHTRDVDVLAILSGDVLTFLER